VTGMNQPLISKFLFRCLLPALPTVDDLIGGPSPIGDAIGDVIGDIGDFVTDVSDTDASESRGATVGSNLFLLKEKVAKIPCGLSPAAGITACRGGSL
jgi:hypothetical protein